MIYNQVQDTLDSKSNSYNLESEEADELMNEPPSWPIRYGVLIILAIVCVGFVCSHFITFPDKFVSKATITTTNPPVKITAKNAGSIKMLFVPSGNSIKLGDPVALIENSVTYEHLLYLRNVVFQIDSLLNLATSDHSLSLRKDLNLGELQNEYNNLYSAYTFYQFFHTKDFYNTKAALLKKHFQYITSIREGQGFKFDLVKRQLEVEIKKFAIDSILQVGKTIPLTDFYESQLRLLNQKIAYAENNIGNLNYQLQQSQLEQSILELEYEGGQLELELRSRVLESIRQIRAAINVWEQKFLLRSPVSGRINYFKYWKENQYLNVGDIVAVIVPNSSQILCKALLPIYGAGKVKVGQKAVVKLYSYPYEEFGYLEGVVSSISDVPLDNEYSIEIGLPITLKSSNGFVIPLNSSLEGTAEVFTHDRSILDRIFDKITRIRQ